MIKVTSVKKFNKEALQRYNWAVLNHEPGRMGGFPCRAMYTFQTPEGYDRKRGFVVSDGTRHRFVFKKADLPVGLGLPVFFK
jgi:hypothetical protein